MQSAYISAHSTETALIKIQSDLLKAVDQGSVAVLLLLDLSAAFDTIDHVILLDRLHNMFGVDGQALNWFRSYVSDRAQSVCIEGTKSTPHKLSQGVPQGSVLGPILFTCYTAPLGNIFRLHNLQYHMYADDSQVYVTFRPGDTSSKGDAISKIELTVHI